MKRVSILIAAVLPYGSAVPTHGAVFVTPVEVKHFAPSPFSRESVVSQTDTWEPPHIVLTNVASADRPVWIANAGDGSDRLFIVQQTGTVIIVGDDTPFLNLEPNSVIPIGGNVPTNPHVKMVSIAFPSDYAHNGYFYVSYYDLNGIFKVSRFSVSKTNPNVADPNSEEVIGSNFPIGCNGGQIVFAPDGTLYLNLAGPIANARDSDALSGKMLALFNEGGSPLPTSTKTSWPFVQYFSSTDCSEIGGEFAENSGGRMNDVYFYGNGSGTIWGLKFNGTNWVKYNLACPTFPCSEGPSITLPPPSGGSSNQLTVPPNVLPATNPPISPIDRITLATNSIFGSSGIKATALSPTGAAGILTPGNLTATPSTVLAANTVPEYPFVITAFGRDEEGRLYVANYGAGYWVQEPTNNTSVEKFGGGGIYLITDDLLQFTVHEVVDHNGVTLEWQSAPGIRYRIQESSGSSRWFDFRPEMMGNGGVLSASNLPYNSRISYRVIAITPGTAD